MRIFQRKVLPLHQTKALFEKANMRNAVQLAGLQIVTRSSENQLQIILYQIVISIRQLCR